MFRRGSLAVSVLTAALLACATGAGPALAASLVVNGATGNDANDCTSEAQACKTIGKALSVAGTGDVITVAAGTYTENLTLPATPSTATAVTINGAGPDQTVVDGNAQESVFIVSKGVNATLSGMTIRNGKGTQAGGGILNNGDSLRLTNVTLSGNTAPRAGGISNMFGTLELTDVTLQNNATTRIEDALADPSVSRDMAMGLAGGGAILNHRGIAMLTNVTLRDNTAAGFGGGGISNYFGTVTLTRGTVSGNTAPGGIGGGIHNRWGTLTLMDVTVSGNSAAIGGGISSGGNLRAIAAFAAGQSSGVFPEGPTILNSTQEELQEAERNSHTRTTMTLTNVIVSNNSASNHGGGIASAGTSATLNHVTLHRNTAIWGGGIASGTHAVLTMTNSLVSDNSVTDGEGGGIHTGNRQEDGGASVATLTNVVISGNTANGAAMSQAAGPVPGLSLNQSGGGGVLNEGVLTMTNVTLSGNASLYQFGVGGGIKNEVASSLTMTNVTLSGNSAGNQGGGIYTRSRSTASLTNVTLSGNTSATEGGGVYRDGDDVTAKNSIFAKSPCAAQTSFRPGSGGPIDAVGLVTLGGNVSDDATCSLTAGTDLANTQAQLGPLADNNGPTVGAPGATAVLQTHALLATSPAVDHVKDCSPLTTDARGVTRSQIPTCDAGAFELQGSRSDTRTLAPGAPATPAGTPTPTPTVTVTTESTPMATPSATVTEAPASAPTPTPTAVPAGTPVPTPTPLEAPEGTESS